MNNEEKKDGFTVGCDCKSAIKEAAAKLCSCCKCEKCECANCSCCSCCEC